MQQSKEQRVHGVFEKIYKNYDQMNSVISFQRHKAWRKDTMKRMNVQKGTKALDVCCGTADWTLAMAEAVGETGEAVGLDFSQNMLKIGEEKVKNSPFSNNSFDYVTIGFGLRNVPDYLQVLKEMQRVVKPGGKVVCLETSQPTMIGYRQMYLLYFKYIMPALGKMVAKSYDEYSWLQESARDVPAQKQLADMFREAGLTDVGLSDYTGGVAAMHLGYKR